MSTLVIGAGAGRTGTTSLAHFLNRQHSSRVTHERWNHSFKWGKPRGRLASLQREIRKNHLGMGGDVALQWGSCLPHVLDTGARVIIMKRDLQPWLLSWKHKSGRRNNWQPKGEGGTPGRSNWYGSFPKFKGCSSKREALIKYWHFYYDEIVPAAQAQYPGQVEVFYVEALNTEAGQRKILDHCQVARDHQVIVPGGVRKNLGRHRKRKP